MRRLAPLAALATSFALLTAGCAGWGDYQAGERQLAADDRRSAIESFREAVRKDPENAKYRLALAREQERELTGLLQQGDAALAAANADVAEAAFAAAVKIQPRSDRAQQGLKRVDQLRQDNRRVAAIETSIDKGRIDEARAGLSQLREVRPAHPGLARLTRLLNRQAALVAAGSEGGLYPRLKEAYRRSVSMSLTNAPFQQALDALRLATGVNFVLDKDVRTDGRVTIALRDKSAEDVLRVILATQRLEQRVLDEDTVLIYPNDPAKLREYQEIVSRSFYISHADAAKTAALLRSMLKVKDVFVDDRLNMLVVRDTPDVIRLAARLIATQDLPDPEVVLELEVLEVSTNRLMEAGVSWPDGVSASIQGASGNAGQLTVNELRNFSSGLVRLQFNDPLFSARLRETNADTNLLANPRIRARNRLPASILIGEKVPVITTSTTANVGISENVTYLDVGLKLEIEPTISLDDEVALKLKLEVSNILDTVTRTSGTVTYRLGTRTATTSLRVRDGETQVLAGLIQREDRAGGQGVPYAGRVPLLGKLFSSQRDSDVRTEIILLVTPRVARNLTLPELSEAEISMGTEASVSSTPLKIRPAAAQPAGAAPSGPGPLPGGVQPAMPGPMPMPMPTPGQAPGLPPPAAPPPPPPVPAGVPPRP